MDAELVKRLVQLNLDFYRQFAGPFAESRSAARLNLEPLRPYLEGVECVLDVGCGNGRLAEALSHAGYMGNYVGVDAIPALVEFARARAARLEQSRYSFLVADISVPEWDTPMRARQPFDLALALSVLQHLPSLALRAQVLRDLLPLVRPGGYLVMSNWQFMNNPRLVGKIIPWSSVGIDKNTLEAGDALLDWKRGGVGCRYCHLLTEGEVETLANQSGWQVCDQFLADLNLNLYGVLQRP